MAIWPGTGVSRSRSRRGHLNNGSFALYLLQTRRIKHSISRMNIFIFVWHSLVNDSFFFWVSSHCMNSVFE